MNLPYTQSSTKSSKFREIQHLAIHVQSNQNETEKTILNSILLTGHDPVICDNPEQAQLSMDTVKIITHND